MQVSADWLLAHVYDPELDLPSAREMIVYAYPLGTLGTQIEEFMDSALCKCGRNGAHKSFPHATLCQFFKCEDSKVPYLIVALKRCLEASLQQAPKEIKLKRYMVQGYIGLFLEEEAASWFREVMRKFTSEARRQGVVVDPHRRQLHVTMAHQYLPEHHSSLEELARAKVDPQAPAKWELRLYSRDHRLASSEVYKVLYPYSPHKEDELELMEGDYIYVSAADQGQTDSEGWFFGTSHNTGTSGLYPGNYVEKSKDSDCWTLHRSWLVSGGDSLPSSPSKSLRLPSITRKDPLLRSEDVQLYDNAAGLLPERRNVEELYARVDKIKKKPKDSSSPNHLPNGSAVDEDVPPPLPPSGPRRLFILRHAERVDVTFGKQWIQLSFDPDGSYHRRNLNMPKEIPKRKGGPMDFTKDSPITETGLFQARLTGEGMREQGIRISHVFSSPALRCVQTANAILQGLQDPTIRIKIENGMFEWLAWCQGGFPTFLSPGELAKFGLQVDMSYASQVALQDLKPKETHLEFYKRMFNITRLILKTVGANSGNIMFVGHAATLEACTRQLVGVQPRSAQELTKIVQKIPYCGVCVCQESEFGKSSTWDFIDPPIPPLTHAPNIRFDWRCLQ